MREYTKRARECEGKMRHNFAIIRTMRHLRGEHPVSLRDYAAEIGHTLAAVWNFIGMTAAIDGMYRNGRLKR